MKAKALVVVLCVMMGLAALSIGTAQAAFTYVTATVSATGGISNGSSYAVLTDVNTGTPAFPANSQLIFDNSTLQSNQFLAAALTAWSTGGKVRVLVNTPVNPFDLIFGVACTN
jgi:hypothetical protein